MVERWLSDEFSASKRELGMVMIVAGMILAAAMLAIELAGTGESGLGFVQWLGIGGGICSVVVGLTLVPLGSQAA